ncbi:beta-lactamase/transpeptidase-like protein [Mycena amicta]|nr:beta-lactamase/transpeptidase-like protein [Mycena amicta]
MLIWILLVAAAALGQCQLQVPLKLSRNDRVVDEELYSYVQGSFPGLAGTFFLSHKYAGILRARNVAGLSLAIVWANGQNQYATWGKRDENENPITTDTIFNLGSCSKAFLSASLGILMQDFVDGKNVTALPDAISEFNWNAKLRDLLLDEWALEDQWTTEKADLKDLLRRTDDNHRHDASYGPYESPGDIIAKMRNLRTSDELRQRYQYNNLMYMTGAHLVSKYSGMEYRDFVEERIFKPLGMTSSTMYPDRAAATGRLTQSWSPLTRRRIPFFMPEHTAALIAGAGGVQSTVEDMTLWLRTLLNQGVDPRNNQTIIPKSTFILATSAISVAFDIGDELTSVMGYGLGWGRLSYRGHDLITHNGGAPGVATRVEVYPQDGFSVVVLANTADQATTRTVGRTVADRVLGLPKYDHGFVETAAAPEKAFDPTWSAENPLAGTYSDTGYGNFTLCTPLFSDDASCKDVLRDFLAVDGAAGKLPTYFFNLYAHWPRFWGTHLRLSPVQGTEDHEYRVLLSSLYTAGYGDDETPFEDPSSEEYTARFVMEDGKVVGLGLFGVAQGDTWRLRKGGSVRETADVWFNKI